MNQAAVHIVVITGMSGSGKSVALRALEDAGFYCVDNLPPELLLPFIEVERKHAVCQIAIAIDVRSASSLPLVPTQLQTLREQGFVVETVFLEASTETLIHRYSETRRKHPLSSSQSDDQRRALTDAIELERHLLAQLREESHVIDSSQIRSTQLQSYIKALVCAPAVAGRQMTLVFESFGFKRGIPLDADFVFDVRMLPNPYYETQLRPLTGVDAPVAAFLEKQPDAMLLLEHVQAFLAQWLPKMANDHRSYVTIAIGCTGGQHRSVFFVERLAQYFGDSHHTLRRHRELDAGRFNTPTP